jgi:hypothetical protein
MKKYTELIKLNNIQEAGDRPDLSKSSIKHSDNISDGMPIKRRYKFVKGVSLGEVQEVMHVKKSEP